MKLIKCGLYAFLSAFVLSACQKDEEDRKPSIAEYLIQNNVTDYKETDSGIIYIVEKQGEGQVLSEDDTVRVHFTGYFMNDELFGSSVGSAPPSFVLGQGQLIEGFEEGVKLFNLGGEGRLFIPNELAYGETGGVNGFGANEDVIFDVELMSPLLSIDEYLSVNEIENYTVTSTGLTYIINEEGTGDFPADGQLVSVHYTGYQMDGVVFDSSIGGSVFSFIVGGQTLIAGWEEGIPLFKLGGKGTLLIPAALAYGESGNGPIGSNEDLRFEISIEAIQ